jgi:hypothetical protein
MQPLDCVAALAMALLKLPLHQKAGDGLGEGVRLLDI